MPTFDIICLANSLKHGGRCIAGFKTDGSGWIRPISHKKSGVLYEEHYTLNTQKAPKLLDIIRINFHNPHTQPHHPEDWLISEKSWQFMGYPTIEQLNNLLKEEVNNSSKSGELLGNDEDRISWDYLQSNPTQKSLCLIRPHNLYWDIKTFETKKIRAMFKLQDIYYDLVVTDPLWKELLDPLGDGMYKSSDLIENLKLENFDPERFLLTISLSEPFSAKNDHNFYCYKLVAAVINSQSVKASYS
jgi:hypothetical protein